MDDFKFITNIKNPCGDGQTFEDYVQKVLNKEAAGIAAPDGEDGKPDKSQGQVISGDPDAGKDFQSGESVDGKKSDDKKKSATDKEAAGEAKVGDQDRTIPISLPADKEFQKGESVDGSKVTTKAKKTEANVDAKGKKEATKASASNWVKISNLNAKEKTMLRKYWLTQYPREYVDAMIEDR